MIDRCGLFILRDEQSSFQHSWGWKVKKKARWNMVHSASISVKATGIPLLHSDNPWQGRETDRQTDIWYPQSTASEKTPVPELNYLKLTEKTKVEKKWNKWSSIKTFDGCAFSLKSHTGQCTLLNWTTDRHTWPLQKATERGKRKNALATKTKEKEEKKDCQWIDKNSGQNGDKT